MPDCTSLYAGMLAGIREWMKAEHPEMQWVCITGHVGDGTPDLVIPVTLPIRSTDPTPLVRHS